MEAHRNGRPPDAVQLWRMEEVHMRPASQSRRRGCDDPREQEDPIQHNLGALLRVPPIRQAGHLRPDQAAPQDAETVHADLRATVRGLGRTAAERPIHHRTATAADHDGRGVQERAAETARIPELGRGGQSSSTATDGVRDYIGRSV